uniref:Argonaute linker 1 domain-containing protein n=1 Tax=Romanomermis culicivorax TaxID=13658 RepID=A0A915IYV1_ROMCU
MKLSFKYGRITLHKFSVSKFRSDYVPHGRCFYHSAPGTSKPLQFGRELKDGFIKSIRCVNGTNKNLKNPSFTLTMNIDIELHTGCSNYPGSVSLIPLECPQ